MKGVNMTYTNTLIIEWLINLANEELDFQDFGRDVIKSVLKDMALVLDIETYHKRVSQLQREIAQKVNQLGIEGILEIAENIMIDGYNVRQRDAFYEHAYSYEEKSKWT